MPTKYKKMLNQQGAHTHTHRERLNRLGKPLTVVGKSEREREGCRQLWGPRRFAESRAKNFMNLITEFFRCNYEILLAENGIFISFSLKYLLLVSVYKYLPDATPPHTHTRSGATCKSWQGRQGRAYLVRCSHNYSVIGPQSHKTSTKRSCSDCSWLVLLLALLLLCLCLCIINSTTVSS